MNTINLRMNDEDNKLVRDYAKANNITISDLVRNAVLEKIEDDIDLKLYNHAMTEHRREIYKKKDDLIYASSQSSFLFGMKKPLNLTYDTHIARNKIFVQYVVEDITLYL